MSLSFVITLREALEASLLVGVVLSLLSRSENRRFVLWVWGGVALAAAVSVLFGVVLVLAFGGLPRNGRELAEAVIMWVTVGILTYVMLWMGRHGGEMAGGLRKDAGAALERGSRLALVSLVFLAVLREGAEGVLYLAASAGTTPWHQVAVGAGFGLVLAVGLGYAIYRGGTRVVDPRVLFKATTAVLLVFAAGLVGHATLALQSTGVLPGTISVWDTSHLVSENSALGAALGALFGYSARPSLLQVIFVLAYVALILVLYLRPSGTRFIPIGSDYGHAIYRVIRRPRLTRILPLTMGLMLVLLLAVATFGISIGPFNNHGMLQWGGLKSTEDENNLFEFALWILWLPLLSVVTLVFGRIWCGNFCPLRLITDGARTLADRLLGSRGSATAPTARRAWLLPLMFILVTFVVKGLPVQQVALYGAIFFFAITSVAVLVGLLFRRGTWCRYLCPVGGWLARIARLSPVALRPNPDACLTCTDKPCITGTEIAGSCPINLNPARLETNQNCLTCWSCVANCPPERSSLKLGWRAPGAELLSPVKPNLWESVFVASLLGMYAAVGQRSPALTNVPWPLLYFGMILAATACYAAACGLAAPLAGIPYRRALETFGYIFLPLEFGTALIAFGDDALEFFRVTQPAAAVLLTGGFVWSTVLAVSILRNQSRSPLRALAAAAPIALLLVAVLFVWVGWYASGPIIDLT